MSAEHTPGPWSQSHRLNKRGTYSTEVYDAAGDEIATLAWHSIKTEHGWGTDRDANARLIAAAPDLLAACIMVRDALNQTGTILDGAVIADAIVKAEGTSDLEAAGCGGIK